MHKEKNELRTFFYGLIMAVLLVFFFFFILINGAKFYLKINKNNFYVTDSRLDYEDNRWRVTCEQMHCKGEFFFGLPRWVVRIEDKSTKTITPLFTVEAVFQESIPYRPKVSIDNRKLTYDTGVGNYTFNMPQPTWKPTLDNDKLIDLEWTPFEIIIEDGFTYEYEKDDWDLIIYEGGPRSYQ